MGILEVEDIVEGAGISPSERSERGEEVVSTK